MENWFEGDLLNLGETVEGAALEGADSVTIVQTEALRNAMKPLLKRKAGPADDPLLSAVVFRQSGDSSVELTATDLLTYVATSVATEPGSTPMKRPVALDLASLDAVVKVQGETTTVVLSESEVFVVFAGGRLYVPSYSLDFKKFDADAAAPGEPTRRTKAPVVVMLDTISALKKLAASADRSELKMLFGEGDRVYACDGSTVMRSDCYFVDTAVKLSDVDVLEALLQVSEVNETAEIDEFSDCVRVSSGPGKLVFARRAAKLSKQYSDAVRSPQEFFYVDSSALHRALGVLGSVRDSGGYVTVASDGDALTVHSKSNDGQVSKFVVSRDRGGSSGPAPQGSIRLRIPVAARALSGFVGSDNVRVGLSDGQLLLDDSNAVAVVLNGALGTDIE